MFAPLSRPVEWTQCVCVLAVSEVKALIHQVIELNVGSEVLLHDLLYVSVQQNVH